MTRPGREKGARGRYEWLVAQVRKQINDETAPCQEWPYARVQKRNRKGGNHGVVVMPNDDRELVHRVAFMLVHGRWPTPCCIHKCDNPPCFWVAHLREATQLDNIEDMRTKGRGYDIPAQIGEAHPGVILSNEQVKKIRAEYVHKHGILTKMGKQYGVSPSTIFDIVNRRSRQDI